MSASLTTARQVAWVIRYFFDRSRGCDQHGYLSYTTEATVTYDDGMDFVLAFDAAFPGRSPDPNHDRPSRRLRRLLKTLRDDGWMIRSRTSNYDQYHPQQEPNWQYTYGLSRWLIDDLKKGKLNPEIAASRITGVPVERLLVSADPDKAIEHVRDEAAP